MDTTSTTRSNSFNCRPTVEAVSLGTPPSSQSGSDLEEGSSTNRVQAFSLY